MPLPYALTLAGIILLAVAWPAWSTVRYVRADRELRRSMRQAVRVRWGWERLARMLGLCVTDPSPRFPHLTRWRRQTAAPLATHRVRLPRLRVKPDPYGLRIRCRTLPKVGVAEWSKHSQHLADAWGCTRVSVRSGGPGRIVVRGIRRDPLAEPTVWVPDGAVSDVTVWPLGTDEYAAAAEVPLVNVAGIVVAGLPGSGKTSLVNALLARLMPSDAVQACVLDGKDAGDYDGVRSRLFAHVGDNLEAANEQLRELVQLRADRSRLLPLPVTDGGLGVTNLWEVGPSAAWPLVVTFVDECHTFVEEVRGSSPDAKAAAQLTSENRRMLADLVKKGRSAGMLTVLLSQKTTGDAVPTAIRDVCPVLLSFAQTTATAARAALGDDIGDYPDASPVALQGPDYVGVCTVKLNGREGFTRVRTPYVSTEDLIRVASWSSHHKADPASLLPARLRAVS